MAERTPPPRRSRSEAADRPPGLVRSSLKEAVLNALDPAERAELLSLEPEAFMLYHSVSPNRRKRRYLELCGKGWSPVQHQLSTEKLIGTGCDPRNPFAPRQRVEASSMAACTAGFREMDRKNWRGGDHRDRSLVRGSQNLKSLNLFYLGGVPIKLTFRLFPVFLKLAEGARAGREFETLEDLMKGFPDEGALRLAVHRIKERMQGAGFDRVTCDALIQTVPRGYRLTIPSAEISFED